MLRLRSALRGARSYRILGAKVGPLSDVNYTVEHVKVKRTLQRRATISNAFWSRLGYIRAFLAIIGIAWIFALPHLALWKGVYIDEHAIQPAQVTMYFDWSNVHKADMYLDHLEKMVNGTIQERSAFARSMFQQAGLSSGTTEAATWAHVKPPRSAGTETILVSANWLSRDGTPNLRGVATLLALSDFLRGQDHWAFDFALIIGNDYLSGLDRFMTDSYHSTFPGVVWTALNLDYPGHSFSHIGVFYEGVNGRLPNQDVPNMISHIGRWAGGVDMRVHNVDHDVHSAEYAWITRWLPGPTKVLEVEVKEYLVAARHLWQHARYAALGRASGGHGVLAKHRIDSATLYCTPATGPHGFHTLGRTVESILRSYNNLLERLHASYFFYLLPRPGKFIPVGHYLPSAVLLGASITLGGFDCPDPLAGLALMVPPIVASLFAWLVEIPLLIVIAAFYFAYVRLNDNTESAKHRRELADRSCLSLLRLFYGAVVPTLAMVNYPQAMLLAFIAIFFLESPYRLAAPATIVASGILGRGCGLINFLQEEWAVGNILYPGIYLVLAPLAAIWSCRRLVEQ